ncbi:type II toxin-antitoxin system death-on-curing family toxin [Salinicoccus sp. HZC-1]|uniref:type II toxin-antitoxin system death-on-curing family toxin n=1 Tax=Salinicoccus sp. HZC-1 TaxID=3385497 RepID=UPI00398B7224
MEETIFYFDKEYAIAIHDSIIEESGGLEGIKDSGRLHSILEHLQNDCYYPTFEIKLTRLIFSVTKFHIFNDGNKRSAIGLGAYFLKINDYDYCTDTFIDEMENIVLWTATGLIDDNFLLDIVKSIINYDCLSNEVKLQLISIESNTIGGFYNQLSHLGTKKRHVNFMLY